MPFAVSRSELKVNNSIDHALQKNLDSRFEERITQPDNHANTNVTLQPKLNGYEACRRIRQLPGGANMVLIALTG